MSIAAGTHLGPYEIQSALGAGGMGQVYKARDTRLDRTVAIKILPDTLAADPQFRERFDREARTISQLTHPHICVLHDVGHQDGIDFLVMEYLEGETLEHRLKKGALPLDQALQFAIQIADALSTAHRHGIVHRDLKPGNVMLTKQGAKLLDFGLAKTGAASAAGAGFSMLPTTPPGLTARGTLLGTFQYMAPEQLEGQEADARTDIFAFGAVLYEMVTGKKAFRGQSHASLISAIMSSDPPSISSLQPMTPRALERVVKRCLAKDREDRWQTARDLHVELRWIAEGSVEPVKASALEAMPGVMRWRSRLLWTLTGVVLGVVVASVTAAYLTRGETPAQSVKRLAISLPPNVELVAQNNQGLELSPDGKQVVFVGRRGGIAQLYRRPLDRLEASPIPGTEGAVLPFLSPNGEWVGFFAGGKLKKVAVMGGTPVPLCDAPSFQGAAWGLDDMIVASFNLGDGLRRVPATGGSPQPVTTLDSSQGEITHQFPEILPGGQALLFTTASDLTHPKIAVQSLKTGQRRILLDGTKPRFVSTRHIVFARLGSLWAVPFDPDRLEVTGLAAPVVEGVRMDLGIYPYFAIAGDGTLVYVPGDTARQLVWVDRKGDVEPLAGLPPRPYETPRLSPDGQRLALTIREENHDVWSYELARGTSMRVTTAPGEDETPVWMPDGKRLVFAGDRPGGSNLLLKLADGSATEEKLLGIQGGHRHAESVSPNGQILAFVEFTAQTAGDIWTMPIQGDRTPRPFLQTPAMEVGAKFSPDGRWIAYVSDESGQSEVYVQSFPGPGGKWKISTGGGEEPVWSRNGRELFYRSGDRMMVVDVAPYSAFTANKPRIIFRGEFDSLAWWTNYDISPDGERFLMIQSREATAAGSQIYVMLNWLQELKRNVPTK